MSAVGDIFGFPVFSSPYVPPGVAYVFDRSALERALTDWKPSLYVEPASSVSGYIQRQANALRADLGLELVDYRAEAMVRAAGMLRRFANVAAEARLGFQVLSSSFQAVISP